MGRPEVRQDGIGVVALLGESQEAPDDTMKLGMNDLKIVDSHCSTTSLSNAEVPTVSASLGSMRTRYVGLATALSCGVNLSLRNGSRIQRLVHTSKVWI